MSCRTLLALIGSCALAMAQGQFTDDFSDGDFTADPAWSGDASVFVVNTAGELQLNNAVAATSMLHSPNAMGSLNDMEWRARVRLSFSGSAANFARVYLVSDQPDLGGPLNGYYLQFGEAGSADAIELFEQTGTSSVSVCRGTPALIAGAFTVGVQVKRDASGVWQLLADPAGGTNYTFEASGSSTAHTSGTTIGVLCTYTISNADNFFFDDFYAGPAIVDNVPPTVLSASFTSPLGVDVRFSEPVEGTSGGTAGNYTLSPSVPVATAARDGVDPSLVHLVLGTSLVNGTNYSVTATGVQDLAANVGAPSSASFTYVVPATAALRDVVINELMADPTPVVGLPEAEFLELLNTTTDRTFELEGWTIDDGGTPVALPPHTLAPGAYVLVMAAASLPLFPAVPNKIGLPSLPTLNNDGDSLSLRNAAAITIDQVAYTSGWYQVPGRNEGGWALEQIDPTSPCSGAANWRASDALAGGTPGVQNSIYAILPDNTPPSLVSVQVPDAGTLVLTFSEAMDAESIAGGTYTISPVIGVDGVIPAGPNTALLTLVDPLSGGTIYSITVSGASDCPGNTIGGSNTASFALPEPIAVGDVVINEVLYDPFGDGSDFVELYNRSDKVISLAGSQLANATNGDIGTPLPITDDAILLLPGGYAVICDDADNVVDNYPQGLTDRFVEADMPSYTNGEGTVVFLDPVGNVLDQFDYSDDLHFELVNNPEGYSLERVDPGRPTGDDTNWQTAADVAGKATPGYRNSQFNEGVGGGNGLTIEPAIFSPDNDGQQDVLNITYSMEESGYVGNMVIYDIAGRPSCRLMESLLLGTEGVVSWNGILDDGGLARMGPYIVVLEVFDLQGNVRTFKKTVTLAQRLE